MSLLGTARILDAKESILLYEYFLVFMHVFVWPDINECAKDNGGCHAKRQCINSPGSVKCADCTTGWTNAGATGCEGLYLLVDWSALLCVCFLLV